MSVQPPSPDDPLAAMAKTTARAVRSEEAARVEMLAARAEAASSRNRFFRVGLVITVVAIVAVSTIMLVRNVENPYRDVDPFADPAQAKAYVAALLDSVMEWSSRHGGKPPYALDVAVPQSRLLPAGSAYGLEYRVEGEVPVVVLRGGKEPIVMRGDGR